MDEQTEMVTETAVDTAEATEQPKTVTVEEFERVKEALKHANKEAETKRKKLEAYEKAENDRKQAEMTELEKAQARLAELEGAIKAQQAKEAKLNVARKVGLPDAFAARLQGETPEELEADAKLILEALPKPDKPAPGIHPTNPPEGSQAETIEQKKARIFGDSFAGNNMFDPEWNRKNGGGVVFIDKE